MPLDEIFLDAPSLEAAAAEVRKATDRLENRPCVRGGDYGSPALAVASQNFERDWVAAINTCARDVAEYARRIDLSIATYAETDTRARERFNRVITNTPSNMSASR